MWPFWSQWPRWEAEEYFSLDKGTQYTPNLKYSLSMESPSPVWPRLRFWACGQEKKNQSKWIWYPEEQRPGPSPHILIGIVFLCCAGGWGEEVDVFTVCSSCSLEVGREAKTSGATTFVLSVLLTFLLPCRWPSVSHSFLWFWSAGRNLAWYLLTKLSASKVRMCKSNYLTPPLQGRPSYSNKTHRKAEIHLIR